MTSIRIEQQLDFLIAADALKGVSRANVLMDGSRHENTAEHSWHLALWALAMADQAPGVDLHDAICMALMHDLVEVYAGDHPIHLPQDATAIAIKEAAAADRLYGLLPADQSAAFRAIWAEFETGQSPVANFIRMLDMTQPAFQELANPAMTPTDRDIVRAILTTGRAAALADLWPPVYEHLIGLLNRSPKPLPAPLAARVRFLAEADQLKTTLRATRLCDNSRPENSGEHSWHIALYALTLAEHAARPIQIDRVIQMLLIHDLVEIDAGDVPIHSAAARDEAAQAEIEQKAAARIFGLLPESEGGRLRALWDEFEAAQSNDAIYAKAIDRAQPLVSNLATGGTSWRDYNVTRAQIDQRVGVKVHRGAPALWAALSPKIDAWYSAQTATSP